MGQFLRDQRIKNVSIDLAALRQLNDIFVARWQAHNGSVPEGPARAVPSYVIRFDEKGYRFVNFDDVVKCFLEARHVERVIYTIDSGLHRQSSGLLGVNCELRMDAKDQNLCWLTVTADNKDWVDTTFAAFSEALAGQHNWNGLVRTAWTGLLVQLLGVVIGFVFGIWAAVKVSPRLAIDNAFAITLVFALLIYSNIWGYVNAQITRAIDLALPNLRFKRPDKDLMYFLIQAVVVGLIVSLVLYVLNVLFGFIGSVLGPITR